MPKFKQGDRVKLGSLEGTVAYGADGGVDYQIDWDGNESYGANGWDIEFFDSVAELIPPTFKVGTVVVQEDGSTYVKAIDVWVATYAQFSGESASDTFDGANWDEAMAYRVRQGEAKVVYEP